jgi:diguanylate cyclase (GGDEF)-like protein
MPTPPGVSALTAYAAGMVQRRYRDRPDGPDPAALAVARTLAAVGTDAIEAQLRQGYHWLRFSSALEQRFEDDGAALRRRHLSVVALIGLVIYAFLSINDAVLLSDVAEESRHLLFWVMPGLLAASLLTRRTQAPWIRETMMAMGTLCVTGASLWNLAHSHQLTAISHSASIMLVPMFTGMALRLRFWYTTAVSITTLLGYVLLLHGHTPQEELMIADFTSVLVSSIALSLIASYSLEYRDRTAWLLRQLDKRRRYALAEANERLKKLSMRDSLTGIGNRRQFDLDLAARWLRCSRIGESLALLLIDIDHFKLYNDCYGHPAGDLCLQRIAAVLGELAEERGGVAARVGGEEFAVILPATGAGDAALRAEGFRVAIRALGITHERALTDAVVTASIGVAVVVPSVEDPHTAIIEAADRALYQAKSTGRNRVCVAAVPTIVRTSPATA